MNTSIKLNEPATKYSTDGAALSQVRDGKPLKIGTGFDALTFREKEFAGSMDPLVMVDHYRMSKPTFGPHPHAGLSAVSIIFEDSEGKFHNRDTLGNDFDLMPGDLYWLKAGAGVVHDESPRTGGNIHGLQVFVNLPSDQKTTQPQALHVKANRVPVYEANGSRVRILLGRSNGLTSYQSPAQPMTILEGKIDAHKHFTHMLTGEENAWVYAIKGEIKLNVSEKEILLSKGQSIALSVTNKGHEQAVHVSNTQAKEAHFALFSAKPIKESFVQKGPFVMSSLAEIERVEADFATGKLGFLK